MICGGSGCYSIASSPMLSPLLGIKTHFWEVGFRDAGPTHFSHLWPFFSRHSCAPSTLGRDLSVWQRGSLVPQSVFRTQLEFLKRNVSGYVCNSSSSRERDAASRGHTSGIPASGCFIPEADAGSTAHVFMLPGRLRHLPMMSRPSFGQIAHVFRARSCWGVPQSVFRTQRLVPSRN